MTVSDILDGAFKLLKANLRTIVIVTATFVAPVQLLASFVSRNVSARGIISIFGDPTSSDSSGSLTSGLLLASAIFYVLNLLTTAFIAGAISRVVSGSYVGEEETASAALKATGRRTWALIASFVLVHIVELVGFALCFLPGLAVMTMFVMTAPAIVVEGLGPIQGMRRSWQLAKGRFWGTLGIALLAGILTYIIGNALALPFGILAGFAGPLSWVVAGVGGIISALVARPFVAIVATLQYYDGRIRTEGFDLQVIATNLARA